MEPLKVETLPTWLSSLPIPPLGWMFPIVYLQERRKLSSVWLLCAVADWHEVLVLVTQSCLTLCIPMDCSAPGSCVCGVLQARILEWVTMPSYRGSSQPRRDGTWVSCIAGRFFTTWATKEALKHHENYYFLFSTFCMPGIALGFMISIVQMMKRILRNVKWCTESHMASKWQRWGTVPQLLDFEVHACSTLPLERFMVPNFY